MFFKGTITPKTEAGERTRIGDVEPIFIAPNDFKTVSYSDLDLTSTSASLDVFTLYGDTPASLEKILEKNINVEFVNIIDRCNIEIEKVKYSKQKASFFIHIKNIGEDCYVDVELKDLIIENKATTLGSEGSIKISKGKSKALIVKQEMTDEDLGQNSFVNVVAYYGEREDSLVKTIQGKFALDIELISFATIGLVSIILVAIIAIIVLLILWKRRKDDEEF